MFEGMDRNGFLTGPLNCNQCGKELSGENGPRPAETYAGTYTGLCYSCEKGGALIVKKHFEGAVTYSYKPE